MERALEDLGVSQDELHTALKAAIDDARTDGDLNNDQADRIKVMIDQRFEAKDDSESSDK
jgi:hypothetical protein